MISLLDCTLRDGGYVNDWKFGHNNIVGLFERMVASGVDIIEIGFLDERRPFDIDRTIMPNTESANIIFNGLDKKNSMVVAMIDYGTCSIKNLQPSKDTFIDGIRVIFKEHLMKPALEYCRQVKSLGYKVFAQLVSVTTYTNEAFKELSEIVNEIEPYALSMVDTYGLLFPDRLSCIYSELNSLISPNISIGFHAHNNFQMAYANSLTFLNRSDERNLVVDGTLFGMGKSAGNAPIEMLAMTLNKQYGKTYKIGQMLEAISESVMPIYIHSPWGYKTFFYLCAKNECHPNYLSYLEGKNNLSKTKIDYILSKIEPKEKKLLYDKDIAEKVYQEYLREKDFDGKMANKFVPEIINKKILLIGPGKNIKLQGQSVSLFINKESPYIISINYIPDKVPINCVFITNSGRYHEMSSNFIFADNNEIKTIATTNVEAKEKPFDFVVNREPLLELDQSIKDNSFLMALKLLIRLGTREVYCAGFDGYSEDDDNYFDPQMEYAFVKKEASLLNQHIKTMVKKFRDKINITFITFSAYDYEEDINSASI